MGAETNSEHINIPSIMNENEKELTGITPELTEPTACQGVNESAIPEVAQEAKEECAETESPAEAMAEAARKVETVGGSVKLVLKKLPEEA